ncbi:MAG: transcription-repair coupling factor [Gammaproteobacteria bacterium]
MSKTARFKQSPSPPDPLCPPLPKTGQRLIWSRLHGDSVAAAIHGAAQQHPSVMVVAVPDMETADRITEHLNFFSDGAGAQIISFPDWETLPYDTFSPHQDIISQRLSTLYRLSRMQQGIVLVPAATLMQRLGPKEYLEQRSLLIDVRDQLSLEVTRHQLEQAGYRCVSQVMEHGEFAVRGSLLDLYPMGSPLPYRIDLLDEEIDSIRTFDPETQRSLAKVDSMQLLPAREFPIDGAGIGRFRQAYRAEFEGDPQASPLYRDVSNGLVPAGIEYYLPLFFEHTATFFDYLPDATLLLTLPDAELAAEQFWDQIQERYEQRRHDKERPLLSPCQLFLSATELTQTINRYTRIEVRRFTELSSGRDTVRFATSAIPDVSIKPRATHATENLQRFLNGFKGRILITAESLGHREHLNDQLREYNFDPSPVDDWRSFLDSDAKLTLTVAPLAQGFILEHACIAVLTESQLFGSRARQTRRRRPARDPDAIIRDLTDLVTGAPVVHEDHGVGRYQGLRKITTGGVETEFLALEYAGGDKLYVPVSSLQLISRYTGASPEGAPLHKLGGEQWQKIRRRAAEKLRDVAAELLEIYARRAAVKGYSFSVDHDEYAAFASSFPFEETIDQETTISQVLADMESSQPMDRVVCGDVGFGKTEVAMRAAFLAAQDGRQTAILVPTTLLAQQHYQNFCDRFADWPIRIEMVSRFRSSKQQEGVLAGLAAGTVDIVIGTHKLLQDNIRFKNLGLVIIDEEHRFGVRQKERLKALRAQVDLLTLTATPIPRTLNMSMSGLRDLSLIATPPAHRLSIRTFVGEWHAPTLREACLREIKRGGQVYVLHNKVATIDQFARTMRELVPESTVEIAHGQMRERELEQVMLDFYHRRFNVLVCTTIIESGIDVPTANTIIINRADRLGLAQLHQLRGRVGRSHHRAYAYLVIPPRKAMSAESVKRLEALEALEELGSGFTLATHDLEIRGAGELLGEDQSGQIQEIGFTMYTELLERTVAALKAGKEPALDQPLDHGPEIDLHIPVLIPDDYLPDVHIRLTLYKRIAGAANEEELRDLQVEMIDRFGLLPPATRNLFRVTELKLRALPLGVRKIEASDHAGRIIFTAEPNVNLEHIIRLVQAEPDSYKLDGGEKLRFFGEMTDIDQRIKYVGEILRNLSI